MFRKFYIYRRISLRWKWPRVGCTNLQWAKRHQINQNKQKNNPPTPVTALPPAPRPLPSPPAAKALHGPSPPTPLTRASRAMCKCVFMPISGWIVSLVLNPQLSEYLEKMIVLLFVSLHFSKLFFQRFVKSEKWDPTKKWCIFFKHDYWVDTWDEHEHVHMYCR